MKTRIFIQSLDNTAWDAVENEWIEPIKMVDDTITKIAKEVIKPKTEWSDVERKLTQANAKALNTRFVSVYE